MYHPSKSDIFNDLRVLYFTSVESFTNIYKFKTGLGVSNGHECNSVAVNELFQFTGILARDVVLGGSNGALYERCSM